MDKTLDLDELERVAREALKTKSGQVIVYGIDLLTLIAAARPAVVSDGVVERMARGFLEGLNEGRSLEFDALQPGDWAELRSAMRSALALLPGGVPDGYMLVPREPTEAMIRSGQGAADDKYWLWRGLGERPVGSGLDGMALYVDAAYRAMLSASPKGTSVAESAAGDASHLTASETPGKSEVTDRKSQWMLENSEGRWLHNAEDGTFTSDPNLGLKWPNRTAADAFRLGLRGPLWALKLTEHVWIEPDAYDWTDAEDDIADAISDSMDMDWSSRDGARAVVEYLKKIGART